MEDNALIMLKSDFENYKKQTDKVIEELKKKCEQVEKRIHDIEIDNTKTDLQYAQIIESLKKLNDETIPGLTKQIQELRNKPAERYNLIINTIISSIAGGIGGYILKTFTK